jgi:hypothetical protein
VVYHSLSLFMRQFTSHKSPATTILRRDDSPSLKNSAALSRDFVFCHVARLPPAAKSREWGPKGLTGIVEGDETFILESFKGKRSGLPSTSIL